MAAQKPSQDWQRRVGALNGNEDLLRQNPVGDASSSPKEERIPVYLISDYVTANIPTIYNANGITDANRNVTLGNDNDLSFELGANSKFSVNSSTNSIELIIRQASDSIEFGSGAITAFFDGAGFAYSPASVSALLGGAYINNSLVHKAYVDGIELASNGGGSYTFTDAQGNTVNFNVSGGTSSTIEQYDVSNGSTTGTVWATGLGITITQNAGAGEITFSIPADVELISANLFMPSSVTDGGAYHIVFDYVGARGFNTTKQNLKIPLIRTGLDSYASASRANPANISENGGNSANTVTYGVSDFGGGDGSDLEMSLINFSIGLNQMCRIDFI